MLAPIVDKDVKQKLFLEVVLRVLEGLINRGFFGFFIFIPTSVQCSAQSKEGGKERRKRGGGGEYLSNVKWQTGVTQGDMGESPGILLHGQICKL